MIDYTLICKCGYETYTSTLTDAKRAARFHVNRICEDGEVYIDRNRDKEIDDSFNSIKVTPTSIEQEDQAAIKSNSAALRKAFDR